jgi:hypothetical protein
MKDFFFKLGLLFTPILYWDTYTIEQNRHYSKHELISYYSGNVLQFDAKFKRSCLYNINCTDGEGDLNKLYGFVDCGSLVHANSARFAWRHDGKGNIEIFAYAYSDSVRIYFKMGETVPNKKDSYEIHADENYYYFKFNNSDSTITRTKVCGQITERARSFPYFGGSTPAPNKMKIKIREKKIQRY